MLTLCQLLTQSIDAKNLQPQDWDTVVRQARKSLLLPQLAKTILTADIQLPKNVSRHLNSATALAAAHRRAVKWELNRIESALSVLDTQVILLKGAAYLAQDMPHAMQRLYGDIDILVPYKSLPDVEERLKWAGWANTSHSSYDERYYRAWMHEIPPLQHAKRGSSLDVHHRILPPTARITVAGEPLIEQATRSEGFPFFYTLDPIDQWLHSAAHLFSEGEADHGLRDLFDLYNLAQHFLKTNPNYLQHIVNRSNELGTSRFTYYALKFMKHFFWPDLSEDHQNGCANQPNRLLSRLMNKVFVRTLQPQHLSAQLAGTQVATKLLYFRGHYLRMPLHLLIPHLIKKSVAQDKTSAVS